MLFDETIARASSWTDIANRERQNARQLRHLHGEGVGTAFVLDTSTSMEGDGFRQMKEVFSSIIDEIFRSTGPIDENVSVLTFGQTVRFVQYPTNNYQSVRRCLDDVRCGGSSPLTAGILVSQAVFNEPCPLQLGGWDVRTRIIVITDGRPTDSFVLDGPDDQYKYDQNQVKGHFISTVHHISKLNQITFVPVGDSDASFFEMVLGVSKTARVVKACDARQLGKYAINILVAVHFKNEDFRTVDRDHFQSVVTAIRKERYTLDDKDIGHISDILSYKDVYRSEEEVNDADEEEMCEQFSSSLIPVGTRVRRGPHWKWRNQDSDGPGTVVGYNTGFVNSGWTRVEWDNGVNMPYRYNLPGLSEPIFDIVECHEPRVPIDEELIAVGCRVTRGPDWKWDEQDGGEGQVGAVYRVNPLGIVHVRWPNGTRSNYRFGYDGMFDVQLRDPFTDHDDNQEKLGKSKMTGMSVKDEFCNNLAGKDTKKSEMSNIPSGNSYKTWSNHASHSAVDETSRYASNDQTSSQCADKNAFTDPSGDETSCHPVNNSASSHAADDEDSIHPVDKIASISQPDDDQTSFSNPVDDRNLKLSVNDQNSNQHDDEDQPSSITSLQCTTSERSTTLENMFHANDKCNGNSQSDRQVHDTSFEGSNKSFDVQNSDGLSTNMYKNDLQKSPADACNDFIWQWKNSSGKWATYPDDINEIINERYSQNPKGVITVSNNNQCFKIEMSSFQQVSPLTGKTTKIRRLCPVNNGKIHS